MHALFLISSAAAAPAAPPSALPDITALGNYPVLQFFGGLTVMAIMLLVWMAGERRKGGSSSPDPVADIHIEGPLSACISRLDRMASAQERIAVASSDIDKLREDFGARLGDTRRDLFAGDDALEKRIRDIEIDLAGFKGRHDHQR